MKLQVRQLLCIIVMLGAVIGMPAFADSPEDRSAPGIETTTTTATPTSNPRVEFEDLGVRDPIPSEVRQFLKRMGIKEPNNKDEALAIFGAILGLSSSVMLVTGAILPACLKRYNLLKAMLGVGIPCGMISLACPAIVESSGGLRTEVGTALVVFFLLLYVAVFFLPAILAFKDKTPKKWLIAVINASGLVVPAVGLVALFLALKDKPAAQPHSVIG